MICIIGDKDTVTGLNLAGIKKSYRRPEDVKDEKVIIVDGKNMEEFREELEKSGKIVIELKKKRVI
ncbi:MAG: V-type ATP synthase subunit F [archaeon]|nr:V-type ATP synthase subunit F [archaeon]